MRFGVLIGRAGIEKGLNKGSQGLTTLTHDLSPRLGHTVTVNQMFDVSKVPLQAVDWRFQAVFCFISWHITPTLYYSDYLNHVQIDWNSVYDAIDKEVDVGCDDGVFSVSLSPSKVAVTHLSRCT